MGALMTDLIFEEIQLYDFLRQLLEFDVNISRRVDQLLINDELLVDFSSKNMADLQIKVNRGEGNDLLRFRIQIIKDFIRDLKSLTGQNLYHIIKILRQIDINEQYTLGYVIERHIDSGPRALRIVPTTDASDASSNSSRYITI